MPCAVEVAPVALDAQRSSCGNLAAPSPYRTRCRYVRAPETLQIPGLGISSQLDVSALWPRRPAIVRALFAHRTAAYPPRATCGRAANTSPHLRCCLPPAARCPHRTVACPPRAACGRAASTSPHPRCCLPPPARFKHCVAPCPPTAACGACTAWPPARHAQRVAARPRHPRTCGAACPPPHGARTARPLACHGRDRYATAVTARYYRVYRSTGSQLLYAMSVIDR